MAWNQNPQQDQQNMNMQQPYPPNSMQNPNSNLNPQQMSRGSYPNYPPRPIQTSSPQYRNTMDIASLSRAQYNNMNGGSRGMYNNNNYNNQYGNTMPRQTYPSPFNNNPYFGLSPLQNSQHMMSPFQRQFNQPSNPMHSGSNQNQNQNAINYNQQQQKLGLSQPITQAQSNQFSFNSNQNQNLSQTQPIPRFSNYPNYNNQQQEEEEKFMQRDIENPAGQIIEEEQDENGVKKPRLQYDKMPLLRNVGIWVLNGREPKNEPKQLEEEDKIFGDIELKQNDTKFKELMTNDQMRNSHENIKKQNVRLFLEHNAKRERIKNGLEEDEKYVHDDDMAELQLNDKKPQELLLHL